MPERRDNATWALAVVAVVLLTRYQPAFLLYPVGAFALAFLFYAAGQCSEPGQTRSPARRLVSEALPTLVLAWAGTAAASAGALLLERVGLSPGGPVLTTGSDALANVALAPLGWVTPPALFPFAWVLVSVSIGRASLVLVGRGPVGPVVLGAAAMVVTALTAGRAAIEPGPMLFIARTAFAVAFCALGRVVRGAPAAASSRLRSPTFLVLGFLAVDVIAANAGGLGGGIERGDLGPSGAASLVTAALIALMGGTVASYAAEVVGERSALLAVGRAWRWILVGCAAVLFTLDVVASFAGLLDASDLSRAARLLNMNRFWAPWFFTAIGLPTLLVVLASRLRRPPREA